MQGAQVLLLGGVLQQNRGAVGGDGLNPRHRVCEWGQRMENHYAERGGGNAGSG